MMKCTAIVLAAGKGSRMNSGIQKQYMELNGFPLIYYALRVFEQSCADEIILVTGQNETEYCRREIADKYRFRKIKKIVPGGAVSVIYRYMRGCVLRTVPILC